MRCVTHPNVRRSHETASREGRRLNILVVIASVHRQSGGPSHNFAGYVASLTRRGHHVVVASLTPPGDETAWFQRESGCNEYLHFKHFGPKRLEFSPTFLSWLLAASRNYQVVHVAGLMNAFTSLAARVCQWRGVPVVATLNGVMDRRVVAYSSEHRKRIWLRLIDLPLIRQATLHVESAAEEVAVRALTGAWQPDIRVVNPVVQVDPDRSSEPNGSMTVLALSRLHPIKNLEMLIDAWPEVLAEYPRARLVVAGSGEATYRYELERLATSLRCRDSIDFTGWLSGDAKAQMFKSARLFVLCSHYESFGRATIEALSYGVPCVVTNNVNMAKSLTDEKLALACDKDPDNIANAIKRALVDDTLQHNAFIEGPNYVLKTHSIDITGEKLEQIYGEFAT